METIVKQARELGTSAGVLLPRSWLNKQVVVTLFQPSKEEIALEIMSYLIKNNLNEEIKGIYLFGSYARVDYDAHSDIDILVITANTTRLIKSYNYEILLVSEKDFFRNLENNLNYQSILQEAKVILNRDLLNELKEKKIKFNYLKQLDEIEKVMSINEDSILTCKEKNIPIPDGVIYSIVLRLREIYLIKCLITKRNYSKESFLQIVGKEIYSAYSRVKRDEKEVNDIKADDALKSFLQYEKWLKEIKR